MNDKWISIIKPLADIGAKVLNGFALMTGIRAFQEPCFRPTGRGVRALPISFYYRQFETHTCAFTAALTVLWFFKPEANSKRLYELIDCDPEQGASYLDIVTSLKACGIVVKRWTRLTFAGIAGAIDEGCPIIASVEATFGDHWVVIYGYGRKPDRVFVLGLGLLPFRNRPPVPWSMFKSGWHPMGNGLICSVKQR